MIAAKENFSPPTPEAYFAWEAQQLEKHEYIDGQVYAMSGGSVNHGLIAVQLTTLFATTSKNKLHTGNSDSKSTFSKPQTTPTPTSASPATIAIKPHPILHLPLPHRRSSIRQHRSLRQRRQISNVSPQPRPPRLPTR